MLQCISNLRLLRITQLRPEPETFSLSKKARSIHEAMVSSCQLVFQLTGLEVQSLSLHNPNIPYLPPEVHIAIAQYVHYESLPRYCLVCKMFADIGKTGMLGIVKLRFTTASVSQFKRIREDKQLSEAVHTLIWDIDT